MKTRNFLLLSFLAVITYTCARHTQDPNVTVSVTSSIVMPYTRDEALERVTNHLDSYNYIVSRYIDGPNDGQSEHLGDAAFFNGLALGLLDCIHAETMEYWILQNITNNNGHYYRHPTIQTESDDSKIALYWGLKRFLFNCKNLSHPSDWVSALLLHRPTVPVELSPMLDDVLADLGAGQPITDATRGIIGDLVAGWAHEVVASKASAYRIHLGFLVLDSLGTAAGKKKFCTEAVPADMPLIDAFCGNTSTLAAFVTAFVADVWEYRLQRSMDWESTPDGTLNLSTPGLDYLMALDRLGYNTGL